MLVEEALVTEEAFGEHLRIIEPVDADDQAAADPALAHALLHVAGGGAACAGDELLRVDSDRAGDRADRAPADGQRVVRPQRATHLKIGRASCRERVCQYV